MCFFLFRLCVSFFYSEVRCQLVDQLKVLDLQLEQKSQQLQDLADYLRRRGEIESEYARSLEKLAERFTSRTKRYRLIQSPKVQRLLKPSCACQDTVLKHSCMYLQMFSSCVLSCLLHFLRKEPSSHSVAQVWLALLAQTRQESKDHNRLSENCSNLLIQPLTHCLEYTQRLAKKVLCRRVLSSNKTCLSVCKPAPALSRFVKILFISLSLEFLLNSWHTPDATLCGSLCSFRVVPFHFAVFCLCMSFTEQRRLHSATRRAAQGYHRVADSKWET